MSSYVDMMGGVRWTEQAHIDRVELVLRSTVTHQREHVLDRRITSVFAKTLGLLIPSAPTDGSSDPFAAVRPVINGIAAYFQSLTPAAMQELGAAAVAMSAIDTLAVQARADSALLSTALDYEDWRAQLAALPAAPTDGGTDSYATQRASLQAKMAAASTATTGLVSQRDTYRLAQGTTIPGQPVPAP